MLNGGWFLSVFFFCQLLHSYVAEPVLQNNAWGSKVISCALIIEDFDINKEGWKDWPRGKKCKTLSSFWLIWRLKFKIVKVTFWTLSQNIPNHFPKPLHWFCQAGHLTIIEQFSNVWVTYLWRVSEYFSLDGLQNWRWQAEKKNMYNCRAAEDKQTKQLLIPG